MPRVDVELVLTAPIAKVWEAIKSVEAYPSYMSTVRSVEVLDTDGAKRTCAWSVLLKGSILQWTEIDVIHDERWTIEFDQIDGDLDQFVGFWSATPQADGTVRTRLLVDFEIGIPVLADMLNPVAARALAENAETMLREIESRLRAA